MEDENVLIRDRKKKLEQIKEMGINPFEYSYNVSHSTKEVISTFNELNAEESSVSEVSVAGRIIALRIM